MATTIIEDWFGRRYGELHPLLQALHRDGGELAGEAVLVAGRGAGGWLGRRMAKKMGARLGRNPFRVIARVRDDGLYWERRFGDGPPVATVFAPVGRIGDGEWIERGGRLSLRLDVDIDAEGGWRWRQVGADFAGVPLPRWLRPRVVAAKRVHENTYLFAVAIALPLLGDVLAYEGRLLPAAKRNGPREAARPGPIIGPEGPPTLTS